MESRNTVLGSIYVRITQGYKGPAEYDSRDEPKPGSQPERVVGGELKEVLHRVTDKPTDL